MPTTSAARDSAAPASAPAPRAGVDVVAVSADALTRRFDALVAVDHVDVAVAAGSIFGLLGPNGAGKSTAIRMLTTLLRPTSGSARVAGFDVVRRSADVRRHIGYVPQLVSADGGLTGRENLVLSAKLYGIRRRERTTRIAEALAFMHLDDAADALVCTYSGGMVRRLELAQALLHHPAVLFLDEPTIGLDPVARHAVWDRLQESRRRFATTVLLTTHDMEEAGALCDHLAIMHAGRIAAIILLLSLMLGVPLRLEPFALLGLVLAVVLGAALFSTFSFVVACVVKSRERFMGIGQVLTMPLFFASNAIYPLAMMPPWLQAIARVNPLTYLVNALRALMVQGGASTAGLPMDFAVLVAVFLVLLALGARLYPGITL